jgi:hypothetical protein
LKEVFVLGCAKYGGFVPALWLHSHLIHKGKDGKGPLPAIERALEKPFKAFGGKLGGPIGRGKPIFRSISLRCAGWLRTAPVCPEALWRSGI